MILATVAGVGAGVFLLAGVAGLIRPPARFSRRDGLAALGLGACLLVAAVALGGGRPSPAQAAEAAQRAEIDQLEDRVATFDDGAKAQTPLVATCNGMPYGGERLMCDRAGARFADAWPKAHQGDLLAGRLVADCLSIGCTASVRPRPADGCAWSLVVAALSAAGDVDRTRARQACADLDAKTMAAAKAQALQLGRQLPAFKIDPRSLA